MNLKQTLSHGTGKEIVAAFESAAKSAEDQTARNIARASSAARHGAYVRFRDAAIARGEYTPSANSGAFGYTPSAEEAGQIEREAGLAATSAQRENPNDE